MTHIGVGNPIRPLGKKYTPSSGQRYLHALGSYINIWIITGRPKEKWLSATNVSQLECGISCPCRCIQHFPRGSVCITRGRESQSPCFFAIRKLSQAKHNYTTKEREMTAMVYYLEKLYHYLLCWKAIFSSM